MYLLLEIGNNILAQVSMQKNLEEKTLNGTFSVAFRILQKVGSPKKQVDLVE